MKVEIGNATLYLGDCMDILPTLDKVDAVVTDPPYGLSFMGKKWDCDVPSVEVWAECLRVLKPGGHLLAFAGTRTQHRMAVRIEDAGFEIRDMIAWVYGSGFPKSLDVSKAIDKAEDAEREIVGERLTGAAYSRADRRNADEGFESGQVMATITAPATEAAKQWQGWGTALKPALEPITVARKPLIGTVAENVLAFGTGALNIDGCRVGTEPIEAGRAGRGANGGGWGMQGQEIGGVSIGRWPANLIHDGSDEVARLFPDSNSSTRNPTGKQIYSGNSLNSTITQDTTICGFNDKGSAARFFYCAKASKKDRGDGNTHPTVKPTDLMAYLCRMVTPPGGVVLDPFMGSGSTGKAAILEGFRFIGIERDPKYFDIACKRIEQAVAKGQLFEPEPVKQVQESMF